MRPVIHLVTREYPFGTGEAFVADEAERLRGVARVVVVVDMMGGAVGRRQSFLFSAVAISGGSTREVLPLCAQNTGAGGSISRDLRLTDQRGLHKGIRS